MREILFKAKRMDNGEWVQGYYVKKDNMVVIYPEKAEIISKSLAKELRPNHNVKSTQKKIREIFPVDPSTACQYTGLEDKNGVKIFEGDIVIVHSSRQTTTVEWDSKNARFVMVVSMSSGVSMILSRLGAGEYEVIGNIHDREISDTQRYFKAKIKKREK